MSHFTTLCKSKAPTEKRLSNVYTATKSNMVHFMTKEQLRNRKKVWHLDNISIQKRHTSCVCMCACLCLSTANLVYYWTHQIINGRMLKDLLYLRWFTLFISLSVLCRQMLNNCLSRKRAFLATVQAKNRHSLVCCRPHFGLLSLLTNIHLKNVFSSCA